MQRGFEKYYGTITGAGSFFDPATLCRGNKYITPVNDSKYQPETYYYTDAISDNAVMFLQEHAKEASDKPAFIYVSYTAAHWPMHALPADIAKYKGTYDGGYAPIRQARLRRLKEMGLVAAKTKISPHSDDWENVANKAWEARSMEVYAAMIDSMDQGIGRIVAELERQGQLENTLILFLQDNGGCAEGYGRYAPRKPYAIDLKPMGPDELQTKIWPPMQTRDGRPVRVGPGVEQHPRDLDRTAEDHGLMQRAVGILLVERIGIRSLGDQLAHLRNIFHVYGLKNIGRSLDGASPCRRPRQAGHCDSALLDADGASLVPSFLRGNSGEGECDRMKLCFASH